MTAWTEHGSATPAASLDYEYDLNSNIRRAHSERRILDGNGAAGATADVRDDWYLYDSMNRVVRDKGSLVSGAIAGGTLYGYDQAGRRATARPRTSFARWARPATWT